MTPQNIQKIFIPKNHFSENHKNNEIHNFGRKKWPEPTCIWKYQRTPWGRLCFWNFLPLVDRILNWKFILQYGFKGSAVAQSVECLTRDRGFEPHQRHCLVSLSKNINPSLVLVQPRKTRPFIIEILLMGCKESNQTKNKQKYGFKSCTHVYFSIWLSALRRQFPLRCPHWLH